MTFSLHFIFMYTSRQCPSFHSFYARSSLSNWYDGRYSETVPLPKPVVSDIQIHSSSPHSWASRVKFREMNISLYVGHRRKRKLSNTSAWYSTEQA